MPDALPPAGRLQLVVEPRDRRRVGRGLRRPDGHLLRPPRLHAHQLRVPAVIHGPVAGALHLGTEHLVPPVPQQREPALAAPREEEVAHRDDHQPPPVPRGQRRARPIEVAAPVDRLHAVERGQQRHHLGLPMRGLEHGGQPLADPVHRHPVEACERQVPQRRRELLRVGQLGFHARRAVEQQHQRHVLFELEELDHQLLGPGVDPPVHRPVVVPGEVGRVVREAHPGALPPRPPVGLQLAAEHLLREQREAFEPLDELGVGEAHVL